jgi:hypothetical protein
MPTEVLIKSGSPVIVLADTTDYADPNIGARTDQLDLTGLSTTAARQSDKIDFGASRAAVFAVTAAVEFATAPTSGNVCSIWLAPSMDATAGNANPGGVVGVDGPYSGTAGDALADSINTLTLMGTIVCTSDAASVVQYGTFMFSPEHRYGTVVVYNEADQNFVGNALSMGVSFTPIIDEVA